MPRLKFSAASGTGYQKDLRPKSRFPACEVLKHGEAGDERLARRVVAKSEMRRVSNPVQQVANVCDCCSHLSGRQFVSELAASGFRTARCNEHCVVIFDCPAD